MKFFVETYGCQMNKADSASIINDLIANGFEPVYDQFKADIIIINTCSVRKTAENRIWGRIGYYKNLKQSKDIILLISGCMAQRVGENFFLKFKCIDIVVGTFQRNKIAWILKNFKKGERLAIIEEDELAFTGSVPDKQNPKKAFLTISYGCNNFCSYCIVPYLRGREHSRPSREIINDINNLAARGVIQITLLGQNVNSYGQDTDDLNFSELLKLICRETDIKWIKYLSSHPKDLNDKLIDVIANEEKISKTLHLAVQSGSDKILKAMNRNYLIDEYIKKVKNLKSLIPKINLTTDIIVGFPGETEEDFLKTQMLLKTVEFDDAYMYKYNKRENTVAAKYPEKEIEENMKSERLSAIIELQKSITVRNKIKRLNDSFEVIAESWSKKTDNVILGLSKEDLNILFKGDNSDFNGIVKLKARQLKGNTLYGEKTINNETLDVRSEIIKV